MSQLNPGEWRDRFEAGAAAGDPAGFEDAFEVNP